MSERPVCAYCGKPAPKLTTTVWVHADKKYVREATNWTRHVHTPVLPVNIAMCRALSNQQVVSIKYGMGNRVSRFSEWDGTSYWLAFGPCCSSNCGREYARACYRAGYRMQKETA